MLAELATYPLPAKPAHACAAPQRRHYAGPIDLRGPAFFAFMRVAEELIRRLVELHANQLACAARWLLDHCTQQVRAPRVKARMHVMVALRALRAEPGWELPSESATPVRRLLACHDGPGHVIPVGLPVPGHLDDAILLEAIWPDIRDDVREHMDFRRLRCVEARLCDVAPFRLPHTRQDRQVAQAAEYKLREQLRRTDPGRYTGGLAEVPRFRVH